MSDQTSPVHHQSEEQSSLAPKTFTEEISADLNFFRNSSVTPTEAYQNIMMYFARKQTIFLYDIRHYLREIHNFQNVADLD